jgi:hypothetical protein
MEVGEKQNRTADTGEAKDRALWKHENKSPIRIDPNQECSARLSSLRL